MRSGQIKAKVEKAVALLGNEFNQFQSGFHISARGVPYGHVWVGQRRYQFAYFAKGGFYRVFDDSENHADVYGDDGLVAHFRGMREREEA